jgi:hypothetical protein
MRHVPIPDHIRTAQMLIERHGLRAAAVAAEHAAEAQLEGNTSAFERWRQVQAAIAEVRATDRRAAAKADQYA